jgi:hypothetical protein
LSYGPLLAVPVPDSDGPGQIPNTANELSELVDQITPEEFSWQEANYSRDSELGRELLYLIANNEWARATSEIIDVTRRHAVETTMRIAVDLDRITHEAFRHRTERLLWLPVFVLPPPRKQDGPRWPEPDPFGTMTVTDASGELLLPLADAEVRHRISAALAEIIVNMLASRRPKLAGTWPTATREHRLLLSAAIYRLLRQGPSADISEPASAPGAQRDVTPGESRLHTARAELRRLLRPYVNPEKQSAASSDGQESPPGSNAVSTPATTHQQDGTASTRLLTERAVMLLQAFAQSAVVVVAVPRDPTRAVLTLKLPSRPMRRQRPKPWRPRDPLTGRWSRPTWSLLNWRTWNWLLPRAHLDVNLLLPAADADRQVRVELPEGVSFDPSRPPAELEVEVSQPPPFEHLSRLMGQLTDERADRPVALQQSIADMAAVMADAACESMRDHVVAPPPDEAGARPIDADDDETGTFRGKLMELRRHLDLPADPGARACALAELRKAWAGGDWLPERLLRRTSCDIVGPRTVVAKASMIEDVSRRGAPTCAKIHLNVAVTDAEYFSIARFTSRMSGLLMTVVVMFFLVTSLLGWQNSQVSAEVLAIVLTLFSAIQAGRIERSDRSTLHGLLSSAGSFLIVATVLPSVVLAVALAFSRSGFWPVGWAAGAIGLQVAIERLLSIRRRWEHDRESPAAERPQKPRRSWRGALASPAGPVAGGLSLSTDAPRYAHEEVLHSGWWRGATANALLIGRPAHGYMIWQRDPSTDPSATLIELLSRARPAKAESAADPLAEAAQPTEQAQLTAVAGQQLAQAVRQAVDSRAGLFLRMHQWLHEPGTRLQEVLHADDLSIAMRAVPEDASVLALQRSGTASQSVTFVVFRKKPREEWVRQSHAKSVKLDPDQLAPIVDGIVSIEIFAGLPRNRSLLPVADHPVSRIIAVAAEWRLFVLDAQLSVPPPAAGYSDLLWARVRVTLHDTEVESVGPFLDAIRRQTIGDGEVGSDGQLWGDELVVAVRTVPYGPLRILNPRPAARQAGAGRVLASDMDIMRAGPQSAEGPDEKAWRIIAICADGRTGVESEIMRSLDSGLRLAGLTYALLYGKAVFIMVGYQGGGQAEPGRLSDRLADGRALPNIAVCLDETLSRNDLGLAQPEPLLRVHMRLPDRAGVTLAVLDSLREMLPTLAPGRLQPTGWQVWYARSRVSDGNTGLITLTARLAVAPRIAEEWKLSQLEDLGRQVRSMAMAKTEGQVRQTDSGFRVPEETALSVRLITAPVPERGQGPGVAGASPGVGLGGGAAGAGEDLVQPAE